MECDLPGTKIKTFRHKSFSVKCMNLNEHGWFSYSTEYNEPGNQYFPCVVLF